MIRTLATLALAGALVALGPAHAQGTAGAPGPQAAPSTQGASGIQNPWETGTDGLAPIPPLAARVTDRTNTLSASERDALDTKLANYEAHTGNQIVVLIVPSTKPEPIEAYSIRVAEAWKIGRKGQDNGVVFLVAKDDHKMRLEVGYGLEGVLTDAMSRRIISDDVAPKFRDNQFAAGINAGVDRIIAVINAPPGAPPSVASGAARSKGGGLDLNLLFVVLFVGVPVIGGVLKRIFGRLIGSTFGAGIIGAGAWLFLGSIALGVVAAIVGFVIMLFLGAGSTFGRRGGMYIPTGGWGGGGFGGGGFGGGGGGFSGGGGSFGGGGASGSW